MSKHGRRLGGNAEGKVCSRLSVRGAIQFQRRASRSEATTVRVLTRLMLVGFRAAYDQPATEKFLVVQFVYGAFRLLDGLHLHKRKTLRALVVTIAYDLCVLHMANAVEQFEEIALGGVEGQVANVKAR